jgi:protein gp37
MAETTGIGWTDGTWNVAVGCSKISEGCKNCYMIRDMGRKPMWADVNGTVTRTKSVFDSPLKWKDPMRIFTSSLTDFFHEQIDPYRYEAFDIMRRCPHHQFQVLTKRIERVWQSIGEAYDQAVVLGLHDLANWLAEWLKGNPPANVWIGVSVACKNEMHRLDKLGEIPAVIRFVSFEPLIEDLRDAYRDFVDWIIIGGESGPASGKWKARPCEIDWIRSLIRQYQLKWTPEAKKAIFVKQLGSDIARVFQLYDGKGEDMTYWPEWMKIREFPVERFPRPEPVLKPKRKPLPLFGE